MGELGALASIVRKIGIFELVQLPLLLAAIALAFARPTVGATPFGRLERALKRLAMRPYASIVLIAGLAIACRAALIPLMHVEPLIPDEVSLRLQAETYLRARLSNPAIRSDDFTSIYTVLRPSYASMYPVLRSLPLVFGKLLGFGFWGGAWLTVVVLCATTYWALRAYIAPSYAIVAALIVVARIAIFSVWVNSYFCPALTALGGLVLIGGYARIVREPSLRNGFFVGAGVFVLMTTRPFEGMMFSIPMAFGLAARFLRSPDRRKALAAPGAVAASLVLAGLVLTAVHDRAVTGDWRKAPYTLYREVSGGSPAFLLAARTAPRQPALYAPERDQFANEANDYARGKSFRGLLSAQLSRFEQYWNFYIGFALTLPFIVGLFGLRRRPVLLLSLAALTVGLMAETFDLSLYASPAFGVIMLCVALGLQRLRNWTPGDRSVGLALSRLLPAAIVAGLAIPLTAVVSADPRLKLPRIGGSSCCWIPGDNVHAAVERALSRYGNKNLVVADTGARSPRLQFVVYNDADLDGARTLWVNEDARLNPQTFANYPGRTLWHLGWTRVGSACLQAGSRGFGPALRELKDERYGGDWRKPTAAEVTGGCLPL